MKNNWLELEKGDPLYVMVPIEDEDGDIIYEYQESAAKMCRSFGIKDEGEVELLLAKSKTDKNNNFNPATLQSDILEVMKSHLQNE